MARSGRSDDLVWTRHAFESGESHHHLDVAVERRALLEELERARERGAATEPQVTREAAAWSAAHVAIATDGWEVAELRAFLAPLGDDAVLALCAAIPTRAAALSPAERTPLVALARRRADVDAKSLAAIALLSDAADAAVLVGEDGVFVRAHGRVLDLSGPVPRERTNVRADEALRRT
jgi:hypothetical protein